jgi:HTH-type transcriptional regulator / antitoxin HigA
MLATDKYLDLIKRFPLSKIETREQNADALKMIVDLTHRESDLTPEEIEYFQLLGDLVKAYESKAVSPAPDMTPAQALKYLMEINDLKQSQICEATDIYKSHLSAFLNGDRRLSKDEIGRLAKYFKVSPLLFVDDDYFGEPMKIRTAVYSAQLQPHQVVHVVEPHPIYTRDGAYFTPSSGSVSINSEHWPFSPQPIEKEESE